ncbi:hypothetical protein [Streptomyces tendae]
MHGCTPLRCLIPLPAIDPDVVRRSALARPDHGPDFIHSDYAGARRVATVAGAPAGHHTGPRHQPDNDTFPPVGAVDDLARLFSFTSVTRWHHTSHQVPPDSTNDHIGRVRTPATVVDRTVMCWHGTPHN